MVDEPISRERTGTCHFEPMALFSWGARYEKGDWLMVPFSTLMSGWPPWRIQVFISAAMSWPLASDRAFHRSTVWVFA